MPDEPEIRFDPFSNARREAASLPWAVYTANEIATGRDVRLAVFWPPEHLGAERVRSGLDWFAEAGYQAQRLAAPAIPTVRAYRSTGDAAYVATDVPAGRTLREHLDLGGPLPVEEAMRVSALVAGALAQAHASGWAHGFLNPETIYLADDGDVAVTDLGLGLAVVPLVGAAVQPWPTRPGFLAPDPRRRDMQCLGLVVAEMLVGRLPDPVGVPRPDVFPAGTPPAVIQRVRALVSPDAPDPLSAAEWVQFARVGDVPATERVAAATPDTGYYEDRSRGARPAVVLPWSTVLVALLAVVILAGAAVIWRGLPASSPPPAPTVPTAPAPDTLIKVQVGPVAAEDEEAAVTRLKHMGFLPYVLREGDVVYIQVGAFANADGAAATEQRLRSAGLPVRRR